MVTELMNLVKNLSEEFTAYKLKSTADIEQLTTECKQLRNENQNLTEQMSNLTTIQTPDSPCTTSKSFADALKSSVQSVLREDVVRQTVQSTLAEQKSQAEVIISGVEEKGQDAVFLQELCTQMDFSQKPVSLIRVGQKPKDGHRLMKATFSTQFDARTFQSRYNQLKNDHPDEHTLRMRPGLTAAQRKVFNQKKKLAKDLNTKATADNASYSFSVRENGDIWKFNRSDDGKWRRDSDWREPEVPKND